MTSGIAQGTVLGPVLFVLYINDLPYAVDNEVYLFADNTKLLSEVCSIADSISLQRDPNKLQLWLETCPLAFHMDKCNVLR